MLRKDLFYTAESKKFTEFEIDILDVMEMSKDTNKKTKINYVDRFFFGNVQRRFDECIKQRPVFTTAEAIHRLEKHYKDPQKEHLLYARLLDTQYKVKVKGTASPIQKILGDPPKLPELLPAVLLYKRLPLKLKESLAPMRLVDLDELF
jgi:hypothetical protein